MKKRNNVDVSNEGNTVMRTTGKSDTDESNGNNTGMRTAGINDQTGTWLA